MLSCTLYYFFSLSNNLAIVTTKHSVWKSKKKSYSTLRAKQATFTFWVVKSLFQNAKLKQVRHFGWFSNTLNLGKNGDIILVLNLDLNFAGNNNASGSMIDDKSKQWFGASVHSSGPDGIIVVNFKTYRENSTLLEHNCNYHPKGNFTAGDSLAFQWWMAGV